MRLRIYGLAFTVAVLAATTAFATIVPKMDLAQLVTQSDSILQGRVEQVYSQWNAELKMAFTYTSIRVDDPLKGERRRNVLIRQVGGKIGSLRISVAGAPRFNVGDDVIVFLRKESDDTFQVLGLNQGKYDINDNFALATASGIDFLDPKTGRIQSPSIGAKLPLDSFKAKIRELIR